MDEEADNYDDLTEIMSNAHLNTNFLALGRELDILEPKTPEDVFKSHLENQRPFGGATGHVSGYGFDLAALVSTADWLWAQALFLHCL